jgi:threonine aldolase
MSAAAAAGLIDLRSDTVTRPNPGMRAAIAAATVGDDQFGEDPTVNLLQERVATLLGKEAAPGGPPCADPARRRCDRQPREPRTRPRRCSGRICAAAREYDVATYLDGARLWNAAVAAGRAPAELAAPFDLVSVALSKGLGAPGGSVL